jgi:hypothetical protein
VYSRKITNDDWFNKYKHYNIAHFLVKKFFHYFVIMSVSSLLLVVNPASPISAPLIITSTSNLTSEEKRNLLFVVDRTLEIPLEVFNNEWWPLVSNIWTEWGSYKFVNGDTRKMFACRFMKHRKSSSR